MKNSLKPALKGAAIVLAAAGLAACYSPNTNTTASTSAQGETVELGHCYGVNVCGGHNDCADVGGKIKDDWHAQIAKAELTQCYGVNACKGHNDCKTAENCVIGIDAG